MPPSSVFDDPVGGETYTVLPEEVLLREWVTCEALDDTTKRCVSIYRCLRFCLFVCLFVCLFSFVRVTPQIQGRQIYDGFSPISILHSSQTHACLSVCAHPLLQATNCHAHPA
jgi:hypothetical protein